MPEEVEMSSTIHPPTEIKICKQKKKILRAPPSCRLHGEGDRICSTCLRLLAFCFFWKCTKGNRGRGRLRIKFPHPPDSAKGGELSNSFHLWQRQAGCSDASHLTDTSPCGRLYDILATFIDRSPSSTLVHTKPTATRSQGQVRTPSIRHRSMASNNFPSPSLHLSNISL
jgi:hypothetical protein